MLYHTWTREWLNLTEMYPKLCSIDLSIGGIKTTVPLRKYIFNVKEAINTLYSGGLGNLTLMSDSFGFICMANHCSLTEEIPRTSNRIGLILGVAVKVQRLL